MRTAIAISLSLFAIVIACENLPSEIGGGACWYEGESFTHVLDADQKEVAVKPFSLQNGTEHAGSLCVIEREDANPYTGANAQGSDWYDAGGKFGYQFGFYTPEGQPIPADRGARYYSLPLLSAVWLQP